MRATFMWPSRNVFGIFLARLLLGVLFDDLKVVPVIYTPPRAFAFTVSVLPFFFEPDSGNLKPESSLQGTDVSLCRRPVSTGHAPLATHANTVTISIFSKISTKSIFF